MNYKKFYQNVGVLAAMSTALLHADQWSVKGEDAWKSQISEQSNLEVKEGFVSPAGKEASFKSVVKSFAEKKSASSLTISQSPIWQNWNQIPQLGPKNMNDAPVFIRKSEGDYWIFARYGGSSPKKLGEAVTVEGYDVPLYKSRHKKQYHAPGGFKPNLGGFHAWQSKDMETWVHHGSVSDAKSAWMTSAELVGDKVYFYYDFPNDQDPHLIIDDDLTDGEMGKKMGIAFKDPSHGSDSAIIRDLDGNFHLILENWDPIHPNSRSFDSPLASHAVSKDGISDFKLLDPAVDYRTNPTGKFGTYNHPHWVKEDPVNFKSNEGQYEIHEPEQDAFGDWAAISVGGQYYLFGDYDKAGLHGRNNMQTAWFTASDINEPFKFCGAVGKGHPDPDVIFAEGQFYIVSQTDDFVSPGPWVDGVEVRVGVDTDNDKSVDQWTEWTKVKESYSGIEGFAKQVATTPAQLDLSSLPEGYGFQFEVRLNDPTENIAKPILEEIVIDFQ